MFEGHQLLVLTVYGSLSCYLFGHSLPELNQVGLRTGLDTDKMDYLLRDQLAIFREKPCSFHSPEQLTNLLERARIVANECHTEIAYEVSTGPVNIQRINDIFQARSLMHEKVYQSGCGRRLQSRNPEPATRARAVLSANFAVTETRLRPNVQKEVYNTIAGG
jgi:hypothetical protein